jgi:hypothetical protein
MYLDSFGSNDPLHLLRRIPLRLADDLDVQTLFAVHQHFATPLARVILHMRSTHAQTRYVTRNRTYFVLQAPSSARIRVSRFAKQGPIHCHDLCVGLRKSLLRSRCAVRQCRHGFTTTGASTMSASLDGSFFFVFILLFPSFLIKCFPWLAPLPPLASP